MRQEGYALSFRLSCLAVSLIFASCSGGGSGVASTVPTAGVGQSFSLVSVKWGRLVDVYDKNNSFYGKQVIEESQGNSSQFTLTTNALTGHNDLKVLNFAKTDAGFAGVLGTASNQLTTTSVNGPLDTYGFSRIPRNAGIRLQFSKAIDPATLNPNTVKVKVGLPPTTPFNVGTLELDPLDSSAVLLCGVVLGPENIALGINLNPTGFPPSSDDVAATLRVSFPKDETPFTGQNEILRDIEGKPLIAADNPVDAINGEIARLFRTGGSFDTNAGFLSDSESPRLVGSQVVTLGTIDADSGSSTQFQVSFTFNTSFCSAIVPQEADILVQGANYGTVIDVVSGSGSTKTVVVDMVSGTLSSGAATFKAFYSESIHDGLEPCFVEISPSPTISTAGGSYTVSLDTDSVFTVEFSEPVNSATVLPFRTFVVTNRDGGADPTTRDITKAPLSGSTLVGYTWDNFTVGSMNASTDLKSFQLAPLLPMSQNQSSGPERQYDLHVVQGPLGVKDFAGNELNLSGNFLIGGSNGVMKVSSSSFQVEGRTFRFKAPNMNESGDTLNESESTAGGGGVSHCSIATLPDGQADPDGGIIGRNANPYARDVDDAQTFIKLMNVTQAGLQTPLVPYGAKMMNLWRYHDVFGGQIPAGEGGGAGPTVMDKSTWHVSVIGLNWSPFGGNVLPDTFGRFKGLLGHSLYAPIARIDANNTTAGWQNTGFNNSAGKEKFRDQALETANFTVGTVGISVNAGKAGMGLADLTTVFDGPYQIQPADAFNSGIHKFVPFPDFQTNSSFTWRNLNYVESSGANIGLPFLGGGSATNEGSDSLEFAKAQLTPNLVWRLNSGWPSRSLPSIALPLLMEFRCFNNLETGVGAQGLNGFASSFMFNTNQTGTPNPGPLFEVLPASRAFSQGYNPVSGSGAVFVYPESSQTSAIEPKGGYCPVNCAPTGTSPATPTAGFDPVIYWGRIELQNIESVFHTAWVDTGVANPVFGGVVLEPAKSDLPPGTDVIVEFRGCDLTGAQTVQKNARLLDPYGNCDGSGSTAAGAFNTNNNYPCTATPIGQITSLTAWSPLISSVAGKQYVQMKVTLVANKDTGARPVLKGIGLNWR